MATTAQKFGSLLWLDIEAHAKGLSLQVILLCIFGFYLGTVDKTLASHIFVIAGLISSMIPTTIMSELRTKGATWSPEAFHVTALELATMKWLNSVILGYGISNVCLLVLLWWDIMPAPYFLRWIVLGLMIIVPVTLVSSGLSLLFSKEAASLLTLVVFFAYAIYVDWLAAHTNLWNSPALQTAIFIAGSGIGTLIFLTSVRVWTGRPTPA